MLEIQTIFSQKKKIQTILQKILQTVDVLSDY